MTSGTSHGCAYGYAWGFDSPHFYKIYCITKINKGGQKYEKCIEDYCSRAGGMSANCSVLWLDAYMYRWRTWNAWKTLRFDLKAAAHTIYWDFLEWYK